MELVIKNLPASAGDVRDTGSIPGSGRSPGEGNGNPLQYSCLENPMDRGACWATAHRVAESDVTEWLSTTLVYLQNIHKANMCHCSSVLRSVKGCLGAPGQI